MNLIKYDSYVPSESPTSFNIELKSIEGADSVVSETGLKMLNVVRDGIHKIDVTYSNITTSTLELLTGKLLQETIAVTFFYGVNKTATMRATSRTTKLVSMLDGGYWNLSFTLEEL